MEITEKQLQGIIQIINEYSEDNLLDIHMDSFVEIIERVRENVS